MRLILSLGCALMLLAASCDTKKEGNTFQVEGKVKNTSASMVYLQESPAGSQPIIIDSARVGKDGSFQLQGTGKEESIYSLRAQTDAYPFAVVINDSKKLTVNADLMNQQEPYTVQGSAASESIISFDKQTMVQAKEVYSLARQIDSLKKAGAADTVINLPFARYEQAAASLRQFTADFVRKAGSPVLGLYALGNYQRLAQQLGLRGFSQVEAGELVNGLAERFPAHNGLAEVKKSFRPKQAPDFTMADTSGKMVPLSSFRGKYLLVDFWASWCRPCREENPNVVKAFNRFRDKNFTILGVSLDKSREAWLQAIAHDGLAWNHVSDLQYWSNAAATLYDVRSIPYNILLDPKGNIVAEDLRGEDLVNKLQEVLK